MDRVVLITHRLEVDQSFVGLLQALFPDCEIDLIRGRSDGSGTFYEPINANPKQHVN